MDLSKLTKGDRVFAGGAIVFVLSSFFNWFDIDIPGFGSRGINGWDLTGTGLFPALILIALLVVLGIARFTTNGLPTLPWPAIFLAGAALAALLVLFRFLAGESPLSRTFMLFVAVVSSIIAAVGAFMKFTESGGRVDDLKNVDSLKKQFDRPGQV